MNDIYKDIVVCKKCMERLPFYKEEYRCFDDVLQKNISSFKSLDALYCLFKYNGNVKKAFIRFKFQGDISVYESFSLMMHRMLQCEKAYNGVDCITSVPISIEKFAQRGFNQSLLIAKEISKLSGIPYKELLVRPYQGVTQSKLNSEERSHARERFSIKENIDIANLNVLIIDDIITSGSTIDGCSQLLKDNGAAFVIGCVFATGRKDI